MSGAEPLTVVVVGAGSIGSRHIRVLQAMPDARVIAVSSRDERRQALLRDGVKVCATVSQALEHRPQGVLIATDTAKHVQDALTALEAGAHVLIEKPIATTRLEADPLLAASKAVGRMVHVACCLRFDDGLRWMHKQRAPLGRMWNADAECFGWLPGWRPGRDVLQGYAARPNEGGVLRDLIHEIDYVTWMLGPAQRVLATIETSGRVVPTGVDDTALITLEHASGVHSSVRLSFAMAPTSRRFRVWGEGGMLGWDRVEKRAWFLDASGREQGSTTIERPENIYEEQAKAWIAFLRTGQGDYGLATLEDGLHAIAVCDAARRSSNNGAWERVT